MKINVCNVLMQALHRKLDYVLVQMLPYNCSETDWSFLSFCEDSPPQQYPDAGFTLRPLHPHYFFFAPLLLVLLP